MRVELWAGHCQGSPDADLVIKALDMVYAAWQASKSAVSLGSGVGNALVLPAATLGGCASSATITGEPGVNKGDSFQKMLGVVSRNNSVTKQVDGQGFRAEGYPNAQPTEQTVIVKRATRNLSSNVFDSVKSTTVGDGKRDYFGAYPCGGKGLK